MNKAKISVVIYTHERTDDARINQEIIRSLWSKEFADIKIVHAYNGKESWYPQEYLEDKLIRRNNIGHVRGAIDLFETGVNTALDMYESDYVIVLASDTWCVKPAYVSWLISTMQENKQRLATCAWGNVVENNIWQVGMAMDFFILDAQWAKNEKIFPIGYDRFVEQFGDLLLYMGSEVLPERVFSFSFRKLLRKEVEREVGIIQDFEYWNYVDKKVLKMVEREPVHFTENGKFHRKNHWPVIGLCGQHDPHPKKEVLKTLEGVEGEHLHKLINSNDLAYYNQHSD